MDKRLKWGIGTTLLGLLCVVLLGITGALQNPFEVGMQRRPVNATAIGGSALLLASGIVTILRSHRSD